MRASHSFSARLSRNILLITSCLFITASIVIAIFSHILIGAEATKNATNALNATILEIEKTLSEVEAATKSVTWLIEEHKYDKEYLYHITKQLVSRNPNIVGSAIAFRDDFFKGEHFFSPYSYRDETTGVITSMQLGNEEYDYFNMEWYSVPKDTKVPHWSEPYFDTGGGQQIMTTYSTPLFDENGEVYAIFTADINLHNLTKKVQDMKPYNNSYAIILSPTGTFISHKDTSLILNKTIFDIAEKDDNDHMRKIATEMTNYKSGVMPFHNDEANAFVVYGPINNKWTAAIIIPFHDVFERLMRMNIIILLVSVFGLFLLFILSLRIIRKLSQPITEFSVSAINMAKGNFHAKLPEITTKDEMRMLYDSFHYMQESITKYISELKTTTAANQHYESELNIARNIQLAMVPTKFPTPEDFDKNGFELHALLHPAKAVGGDLYDFFTKEGKLYFAVGDVSGKGVPASLFMAITKSAFRFTTNLSTSMQQVMNNINAVVAEGNASNMFVTLFIGMIDLASGVLHYCNAGHNPIVIIDKDGNAKFLHARPNLAVGLFDDFQYQEEHLTLERGSRLIIYTDGVTEAENKAKQLFGDDRLIECTNGTPFEKSSKEVIDNIISSIHEFTNGAEQNDDITILSVKY